MPADSEGPSRHHGKPVYTGSYQDTIVKAMTAAKSGDAPDVSVLLSTDMFTLIDEDAIVPFEDVATTDDDQAWIKASIRRFMENSQTGGKTWGIPFQRSTIVQYWNKDAFKDAGLDPDKAPATWDEMVEFAQEADQARRRRQRHAMGRGDPLVRLPLLAVPGADHPERRDPRRTRRAPRSLLRRSEGGRRAAVLGDLSQKDDVMPKGIIDWGTTPKDFFESKTAMMWTTTGNLTNVSNNAKFAFGVAMLPAESAAAAADRRRQHLPLQEGRRRSRRPRSSSSSG